VLLGDFGISLAPVAADLGNPMQSLVVLLLDALDAVHELRNDSNCVHWLYAVESGPTGNVEVRTCPFTERRNERAGQRGPMNGQRRQIAPDL
jgi:hypothetical protein